MCATGECHDCSVLADLEIERPYRVTCLHCGEAGAMVRHRGELMHAECIPAFEVLTDNAGAAS